MGKTAYEICGFIMYTVGLMQIYLMTIISCEK